MDTATNKLKTAIELTRELLDEQGLHNWNIVLNKRKSAFGTCNPRYKQIELSLFLLPFCTDDSIWNTITHEVAHAIEFVNYGKCGHSKTWKRICLSLGGNGLRCSSDELRYKSVEDKNIHLSKISKYSATCINGHKYFANRKPKRKKSCGICCKHFDERFILNFEPL